MSEKRKKKLIIVGIAILILAVISQVLPGLIAKVKPTKVIQYGEISIEDKVKGYILRNETVYLSGDYWKVEYKVKEGALVKADTGVISYKEDKSAVDQSNGKEENKSEITARLGESAVVLKDGKAKRKGVVSTFIDGYENYFTAANFKNIKLGEVESLKINEKDVKDRSFKKNFPVYKISDQSRWHILFWVDKERASKYKEGQKVTVNIGEKNLDFKIEKVDIVGKHGKILIGSNRYYEDFAKTRELEIKVQTVNLSGIVIPNKNITEKDGKKGVYVLTKTGEERFTEIKILGTDGENSVVKEGTFYDDGGNAVKTVKVFDEIVNKK